jgi:hypothetical protein
MSFEIAKIMKGQPYFAPSALEDFKLVPPGPMAQAFTFRAFGAESGRCFHTASVAVGSGYLEACGSNKTFVGSYT